MKKETSFEASLNRLTEITEIVESGGVSLEETLSLYKEGLKISKACEAVLSKFEKEITVLQKETDGLFTQSVYGEE